jgi:uncharacterized protein (TIGR02271 family)
MIDKTSAQRLIDGGTVIGQDGDKIGKIGQVYLDDETGTPSWVTVKTGLFGTSETFVPLDAATMTGDDVTVPYSKSLVKDAPRVEADGQISPAEEDELYRYYSLSTKGSGLSRDADAPIATAGPTTADTNTGGEDFGTNSHGTVGHDTSGPTTDSAMTRSEEQLRVGTQNVEAGRARLRKYVVTEQQTVTVPVTREEVEIVREPITDANVGAATDGPDISEEEHEVTLHAERAVVDKDVVPVERVSLGVNTVTEQQRVTEGVRKEVIETDGDTKATDEIDLKSAKDSAQR